LLITFPNKPTKRNKTGVRPSMHKASAQPLVNPNTKPDTAIAPALEIYPAFSPNARCID